MNCNYPQTFLIIKVVKGGGVRKKIPGRFGGGNGCKNGEKRKFSSIKIDHISALFSVDCIIIKYTYVCKFRSESVRTCAWFRETIQKCAWFRERHVFLPNSSIFAWKSEYFIDCMNAREGQKICVIAWSRTPQGGLVNEWGGARGPWNRGALIENFLESWSGPRILKNWFER